MAESENVETAANFWLPSDFLADDDFLPSDAKKPYNGNSNSNSNKDFLSPSTNLLTTGAHRYTNTTSLGSTPTTLGSPGDSSVTSSAEADDTDNYRDELLAELTRQLAARSTLSLGEQHPNAHNEKIWGPMATSPQSTLSGFPGWSNRSASGPTHVRSPTPPLSYEDKEEALELIYAAAGQVARMKMVAAQVQAQAQMRNLHHHHQNRGLLSPPACNDISSSSVPFSFTQPNSFHQLKVQSRSQSKGGVWASQQDMQKSCFGSNGGIRSSFESGRCCAGGNGNGCFSHVQPALSSVRVQHHEQHHPKIYNHHLAPPSNQTSNRDCSGMRVVFLGPTTAAAPPKKQSTGTGVFLPRTYINNKVSSTTSELPRKNKGCSSVLLPARVVQALNLHMQEDVNGRSTAQSHSQLLPGGNHHDILLMARRNAILAQQQRGRVLRPKVPVAHRPELLPQDWTY